MKDNKSMEPQSSQPLTRESMPLSKRQILLLLRIKKEMHDRLLEYLDLKKTVIRKTKDKLLMARVKSTLFQILRELSPDIPSWVDKESLVTDVYNETLGLGPLEEFIDDPEVSEIMVNSRDEIYIEKNGVLCRTDKMFISNNSIMAIIERIISPIGRRIDESSPLVDARLPDGSRVHIIIPPISLTGPIITIRKFLPTVLDMDDLIRLGSVSPKMVEFLRHCVLTRQNIVTSGKTSSGKTTLLNILSSFIPNDERIITIEDSAELQMRQEHVIRLESRPANIEGKGEISIRELFRNSLRMRPDRIIVGECRMGETLDMLQAMNTGHDGSLTTAHANSPMDLLTRLETMALMGNSTFPVSTVRRQIASAINVIVHLTRFVDGSRKVTQIAELTSYKNDQYTMQDIYRYKKTGMNRKTGMVEGYFETTGYIPKFVEKVIEEGYEFPKELFNPSD